MEVITTIQLSVVSIHAPREGCDNQMLICRSNLRRFNSRTPGGVRLSASYHPLLSLRFQFTHPGRGATGINKPDTRLRKFQFTHPGRGATHQCLGTRLE